jgi:calcium-dependent protein kinase
LQEHFGTPYYIAPEVIRGDYGCKADVWSCGVIFYTLLLRQVPFDGKSDQEILNNIINKSINFKHRQFSKLSLQCVDLMKNMLYKEEKNRSSSHQAYLHTWLQTYGLEGQDKKDM